jgi:PAS domain S-box-containing protein
MSSTSSFKKFLVPILVLTGCLVVTGLAVWQTVLVEKRSQMAEIKQSAIHIRQSIESRLNIYAGILYGVQGLYNASDSVERSEFKAFVETEDLINRYAGTNSISFIQVVDAIDKDSFVKSIQDEGFPDFTIYPEADQKTYYVIKYIEPLAGREKLLGMDYLSDKVRQAVVERARDTGGIAMSEITRSGASGEKIFILALPIYKKDQSVQNPLERRAAINGLVVGVFAVDNVLAKVLNDRDLVEGLDVEIFDESPSGQPQRQTAFYDSDNSNLGALAAASDDKSEERVSIFSREWSLLVAGKTNGFFANYVVYVVLALGLVISFLIAYVLFLSVRARNLAVSLAQDVSLSLKQSERKFKELFDNVEDAIFVHPVKPDGRPGNFIEVNSTACRRLGYTREEFLKMSPEKIDAPENLKNIPQIMAELKDTGHANFETIHVAKSGQKINVEIHASYFIYNGQWLILSVARDITTRKIDEVERLRQSEELEKMNKLMVGRELNMVGLKKELERLKNLKSKK